MNDLKTSPDLQHLSASELRKLPPDERDAILRAQAALAEGIYRRVHDDLGGSSMTGALPRYGMEEYASRGDAIYDREVRPSIEPGNEGKFVAIDIETGDFEVNADELAASDRLLSRRPDAQTWLRRVGSRYARRIGSRPQPDSR